MFDVDAHSVHRIYRVSIICNPPCKIIMQSKGYLKSNHVALPKPISHGHKCTRNNFFFKEMFYVVFYSHRFLSLKCCLVREREKVSQHTTIHYMSSITAERLRKGSQLNFHRFIVLLLQAIVNRNFHCYVSLNLYYIKAPVPTKLRYYTCRKILTEQNLK